MSGGVGGSRRTPGGALVQAPFITLSGMDRGVRLGYNENSLRVYRGIVRVSKGGGNLKIVNIVGARDYVTSVVGSETNPDFPLAQLQAQAVLVQTMLARYKPGDALGDTTEKEAYLGAEYERDLAKTAVNSVWNQMLYFRGRAIQPYFHSTCAGGTSDGARYFQLKPKDGYSYLGSTGCRYCKGSPFWKEKTATIPRAVFFERFGSYVATVVAKDNMSRPLRVDIKVAGKQTPVILNGFTFWTQIGQKLGWDKVPGTRYSIARTRSGDLIFKSTGAGHGVGMCQWGASEMAKQGKSYKAILQYYFPGTYVQQCK